MGLPLANLILTAVLFVSAIFQLTVELRHQLKDIQCVQDVPEARMTTDKCNEHDHLEGTATVILLQLQNLVVFLLDRDLVEHGVAVNSGWVGVRGGHPRSFIIIHKIGRAHV